MPATEVRIEKSMGIDRCVMETITQQSLSGEITKNPDARSYREDQVDGVYTLVEEFLIEQGEPQWSFDGSLGTEPLESHPAFNKNGDFEISEEIKNRWAVYKKNPTDPFLAGKGTGATSENKLNLWQPAGEKDPSFVVFYSFIRLGQESYYVGRVTARMTILEVGAPNCSGLGKIEDPDFPNGFSKPEGSTFILSGIRSQQEGDRFRTTYEYQSSPAGTAWNIQLY